MEEDNASEKIRIYVGGLGEAMMEDDLKKIFHSVGGGVVESIDIIRTKSRSFAYVDFSPSSHNSLSKIFSTYNGCAWKGGKLRLEKAKEHYLVRLRREWEEDAEFENWNAAADLEVSVPEEPAEKDPMSQQIQIFFPSLGKVKSLPFSGTGKHEYSFPNVEVPPLPVHFCDCEEHAVSASTGNSRDTNTGDLAVQNGVMDDTEIKMMSDVMNKILERHNTSATKYNGTIVEKDESNTTLDDNQQFEDNKVDSDEDSLVLNVIASDSNTTQTMFKSNSSKDVSKDQKSNRKVQNKKRKSFMNDDFEKKEPVSTIPTGNASKDHVHQSSIPSGSEPCDVATQIHSSRPRKSSWKALISDTSSIAFSIANILPSVPSAGKEQLESDGLNLADSTPNENSEDLDKDQKSKSKVRNKKRKSIMNDEFERNDYVSSIPAGNASIDPLHLSTILPRPEPFDPAMQIQSPCSQKSSQKATINDSSSVALSITNMLPSVPSAGEEQLESDVLNLPDSTSDEHSQFTADAVLESKSEETSITEAQQTISKVTLNEGRGSSWLAKSSWTQLVSSGNSSAFSITQILPGNTSENHLHIDSIADNVKNTGNGIDKSVKQDEYRTAERGPVTLLDTKEDFSPRIDVSPASAIESSSHAQVIERRIPQQTRPEGEETCTFMRNSRSLAEWAKIKATLTGASKKKKSRDS